MILFSFIVYKERLNRSQRDRLEPSFGATLEGAPRRPQTPGATPRGRGGEGGGGRGETQNPSEKMKLIDITSSNRTEIEKNTPFQCCFKSNLPGHTAKAAQIQATFCTPH